MSKSKLNPAIAVLLMLGCGLILTFSQKIWLNLVVFGCTFIYLLACHVDLKKLLIALCIAFPFALGSWLSFIAFSHEWHTAWLYGTRIYVYFILGALVTMLYSLKEILASLHQHFYLPNTFVYGILTAVNMFHKVNAQIKKIRISANMRGKTLYWWNPMLYLKIIVSCLTWSDILSQSLVAQGFSDNYPRTILYHDQISYFQWGSLSIILLSVGICAFI